jgi:multidrug efflux pump subunit AcrA (membrane-fusion protein)
LATRGPQLRIREAAVERARTTLTRAQLDVDRCSIRLPYTAVIESVAVTTGSLARSGEAVGVAYPVDVFWVRASLPVEQLRWVDSRGSRALVFPQGARTPLDGKLRQITPKVEERGSLGQVLVEVPLEMTSLGEALPVKAGEFVRVVIPGRRLQSVFVLPRRAFHAEGELWLVKADNTLDIRQVKPIYAARDVVIVGEGLSDNEWLITSQLSQPVHGMSVRIQKDDESPHD